MPHNLVIRIIDIRAYWPTSPRPIREEPERKLARSQPDMADSAIRSLAMVVG